MDCRAVVLALIPHRRNSVVVSTMTSIKWIDQLMPSHDNISCVPLMGGASALGLGIALACPDRKVIVLDGDGSLLMQLGSLVTIANAGAQNLIHIVLNNGVWFENMANLPLPTSSRFSFTGLAAAAGYRNIASYETAESFAEDIGKLLSLDGPSFLNLKVTPDSDQLWFRDNPQREMPDRQFLRMGEESRRLRERLMDRHLKANETNTPEDRP